MKIKFGFLEPFGEHDAAAVVPSKATARASEETMADERGAARAARALVRDASIHDHDAFP